jgi:hypothetical protein
MPEMQEQFSAQHFFRDVELCSAVEKRRPRT